MRRLQRSRLTVFLLALNSLLSACVTKGADDSPALTKDQIKQFLLTAQVVNVHQSKKGITNTKRLTLSDGTITHDASFQPVDEHTALKKFGNGRSEVQFVDSYKYNIAAYALAELVGFDDMMPVYVERKYEGQTGSLSWWLPVKMDEADRVSKKIEPPDGDAWNRQMYKVRVFDELVYDSDANLSNVLIGANWQIWRIDFTRAFRLFHNLKDPKDLERCDRVMFERLKVLKADDVTEKTKPYLNKEEVKAVMVRRDIIVAFFQKQIAAKGESEVLY